MSNNRVIVGLSLTGFSTGVGVVLAWRLPADGLSAITAMALTAVILIVVMVAVMGIMAWMVVRITTRRTDNNPSPHYPSPAVMVFGQQPQPSGYLPPVSNGHLDGIGGARQFTIIGEDEDE